MKSRLAILIPTMPDRKEFLERLLSGLKPQCEKYPDEVSIIILNDNPNEPKKSTGEKRNLLTEEAIAAGFSHRAFVDDDDTVTDDYLDLNMPGVRGDYDCNSLIGIYSVDGVSNPDKHIFIHSLKYSHWYEDASHYYRNPNHLNVIKLSLIKDIKFQHKHFGEDGCWSEDLAKAGVLKREYEITKPFYNYLCITKPKIK
jgi:hypothetical protein